jgi:hypothetical protein
MSKQNLQDGRGSAELAQYLDLKTRTPVSSEPIRSMTDAHRLNHFRERCIVWEWQQNEKGEVVRVPVGEIYPDILDTAELSLSHLESISDFDLNEAIHYYGLHSLDYHIAQCYYMANPEDRIAPNLNRNLRKTIYGNTFGKARAGAYMRFLPHMVGGTRRIETADETKKRPWFR